MLRPKDLGETPTSEVRVYCFGQLLCRLLSESTEQAAEAVGWREEIDGVVCDVDDLTNRPPQCGTTEPERARRRCDPVVVP